MSVVYKKLEDVCEILDSRRVPITAKDRKLELIRIMEPMDCKTM